MSKFVLITASQNLVVMGGDSYFREVVSSNPCTGSDLFEFVPSFDALNGQK